MPVMCAKPSLISSGVAGCTEESAPEHEARDFTGILLLTGAAGGLTTDFVFLLLR